MNNHTDLLNYIARKINAEWYLEIGVGNGNNFKAIEVKNKRGVDPDPESAATLKITSDHFWAAYLDASADLVFIDGYHSAEQVRVDLLNAYEMIEPGAVIVAHDCNPSDREMSILPRKQKIWTGDVYKTICQITSPAFFTIDFDYGCCVIRKSDDPLEFHDQKITWELFDQTRTALLNLHTVDESIKIIDSWT